MFSYALLDHSPQIDVVHLKAALALWAYCEASTRFIFGEGDETQNAIVRELQIAGNDGMSRTDIYRFFGCNRSSDKITEVLMHLKVQGKARCERQSTPYGRKREMWFAV